MAVIFKVIDFRVVSYLKFFHIFFNDIYLQQNFFSLSICWCLVLDDKFIRLLSNNIICGSSPFIKWFFGIRDTEEERGGGGGVITGEILRRLGLKPGLLCVPIGYLGLRGTCRRTLQSRRNRSGPFFFQIKRILVGDTTAKNLKCANAIF